MLLPDLGLNAFGLNVTGLASSSVSPLSCAMISPTDCFSVVVELWSVSCGEVASSTCGLENLFEKGLGFLNENGRIPPNGDGSRFDLGFSIIAGGSLVEVDWGSEKLGLIFGLLKLGLFFLLKRLEKLDLVASDLVERDTAAVDFVLSVTDISLEILSDTSSCAFL